MAIFTRFYLDREKDIIVTLEKPSCDYELDYTISTPNHGTGNLITNLAVMCGLGISMDENGLKVIKGKIPSYIDQYNNRMYIFRLAGTKVANIFPDGRVEMKASVPAISKTLMSQTKNYKLDEKRTIIKTYIFEETKFRTDLHTHMNANLPADTLIALGIFHQLRYPLYYIKKLGLRVTEKQKELLLERRGKAEKLYLDSGLEGRYLDRKIDDNTFINFASLILDNTAENTEYNIPKIRNSLAVMKDGQAVFTNLEKVYLYRYVFTKGEKAEDPIDIGEVPDVPDEDINKALRTMYGYRNENSHFKNNSLFQDKLLLTALWYKSQGINYVEISDTTLAKRSSAAERLKEIHEVMPYITEETGVVIRFLAAIRRIPLTIVKDHIESDYFSENINTLRAVAMDPYVAGSDFVGEEINDVMELKNVISEIVKIAKDIPSFVVRIHAGENDSLKDNVMNSVRCVMETLAPGQKMPHLRIGHGLYTANLRSEKGRELIDLLKRTHTVLEFQITSNVRLNNLNQLDSHPLKEYLRNDIFCVEGTDGGALYGTTPIDEQLALEKMLGLTKDDLLKMKKTEEIIVKASLEGFHEKLKKFDEYIKENNISNIEELYNQRIGKLGDDLSSLVSNEQKEMSSEVLASAIAPLPDKKLPVIVAGGSFNNDRHRTVMKNDIKLLIDNMLSLADPDEVFFVIGHKINAYEKYLCEKAGGRFDIYAFVPSSISENERKRILNSGVKVRVAIEPLGLGTYKSIAYEIFKNRRSVLIALDGNSAGANLIQEAKNGKNKCTIFVHHSSKSLREKAESLRGYAILFKDTGEVTEKLKEIIKQYRRISYDRTRKNS